MRGATSRATTMVIAFDQLSNSINHFRDDFCLFETTPYQAPDVPFEGNVTVDLVLAHWLRRRLEW